LWDSGCLGVEVRPLGGRGPRARVRLDAYYAGGVSQRAVAGRLAAALRAVGLGKRSAPRLREVADRRWAERWQKTLRPMAIGRRFLVVPEGCAAPAAGGRHVLKVRFGQAFGTGEHATTRAVLRLMERWLRTGDRVLDLGTGTGILAMAAFRLGSGPIAAIDSDPAAIAVARANLRLNGLDGRILLTRTDALSIDGRGPIDLALVNIGAGVIRGLLPRLAPVLSPRARAILAGLLIDDEEEILAAARAAGLRLLDRRRSRPWSALVLGR
jgi:ribosomal protein L11 methyltransferase